MENTSSSSMEVSPPRTTSLRKPTESDGHIFGEMLTQVRQRNEREFGQFEQLIKEYQMVLKRTNILHDKIASLEKEVILKAAAGQEEGGEVTGTERAAARAHLKALEKKILDLQTTLARVYKKDSEGASKLLDLTQKNEKLREELSEAEAKVQNSADTLRKCRGSMTQVKTELSSKSRECDVLRSELSKVRELLEKGEQNIRELSVANEALVEQMIKSKSSMGLEMNKITSILENKTRTIAELESEVKELKKTLKSVSSGRRRSSSGGSGFWGSLTKSKSSSSEKDARAAKDMMNRTSGWSRARSVTCPSASVHFFQAHKSEINDIAFCVADGREVCVTASSDNSVRIWDTRSGQGIGVLRAGSPVLSVCARNGLVVGGTTESEAIVWTIRTLRTRHKMTGHRGKVVSVDFASDGRKVVTAATDRTLKVWDVARNACLATLHCPSECTSAKFTLDGSLVVSGHKDSGIRLWDLKTNSLQREIKNVHRACITCIAVAPGGTGTTRILTGSRDNSIALIDSRSFMEISRFRDLKFRVGSVYSRACFSPRAGYVAAGGGGGSVFVWDTSEKDAKPQLLDGHTSCIKSCAWGNRVLGTGDSSGYLALWM